jgi:hypothetical protein
VECTIYRITSKTNYYLISDVNVKRIDAASRFLQTEVQAVCLIFLHSRRELDIRKNTVQITKY